VSQSVKKLEEELGTPLLVRDGHDLALTDAHQRLVDYARKMVRTRDDALRDLGALKNLTSGTLNIGGASIGITHRTSR
jgi:DNA-binding transcriptional LysR family regulator